MAVRQARLATRSAADQANRDAWAQRYKRLDKGVRRAMATAKYGRSAMGAPSEAQPFGSRGMARARTTTRELRSSINDTGFALASNRAPGERRALSRTERAALSSAIQRDAGRLRARQAVTATGARLGGDRQRFRGPRPQVRR